MGLFVTFEGIEGCGKSTQISRLTDYLSSINHPFIMTREPGGTSIGGKIRSILLDSANMDLKPETELLLYAADRAQHVESVIRPALAGGKTVLCDRFSDATMAYQGNGRGLNSDLIMELNRLATAGLKPDLTLLIDCPVEVGLERAIERSENEDANQMRFENESLTFHQKIREGYLAIAQQEPSRVVVIDGNRSVEEVYSDLLSTFLDRLRLSN